MSSAEIMLEPLGNGGAALAEYDISGAGLIRIRRADVKLKFSSVREHPQTARSPIVPTSIPVGPMMVVSTMPAVRIITATPVVDLDKITTFTSNRRWQGGNCCGLCDSGNGHISHCCDRNRTCDSCHIPSSLAYLKTQGEAHSMNRTLTT